MLQKITGSRSWPWLLLGMLVAVIFGRWEIWNHQLLEYDELIFTNAANQGAGGLPGVDFEANTTGFLSIWLIGCLKTLGFSLNFLTLRIWGFLWGFLFSSLLLIAAVEEENRWKMAVIYSSFWLVNVPSMLSYNTEWLGLPFIALGYLVLAKRWRISGDFILGLLLVILPFLKLQFVLFGILFWGLRALDILFSQDNQKAWRLLILLGLPALILVGVSQASWWEAFAFYYFKKNVFYTQYFAGSSHLEALMRLVKTQMELYFVVWLLLIFFVLRFFKSHSFFWQKSDFKWSWLGLGKLFSNNLLGLTTVLCVLVGLISIHVPKNNFFHYHELMFVGFSLGLYWGIQRMEKGHGVWAIGILLAASNWVGMLDGMLIAGTGKGFTDRQKLRPLYESKSFQKSVHYLKDTVGFEGKSTTALFLGNYEAPLVQFHLKDVCTSVFRCPNILLWAKMKRLSPELWKQEKMYFFDDFYGKNRPEGKAGMPQWIVDSEKVVDAGLMEELTLLVKQHYVKERQFGGIALYRRL